MQTLLRDQKLISILDTRIKVRSTTTAITRQTLEKYGHTVAGCYHRMDDNYIGQNVINQAPDAYVIDAPEGGPDHGWSVDSRNSLNLRAEYKGDEKVILGNGPKTQNLSCRSFHI